MGVDPGLTRCGLSLIEGGAGRSVVALDVDVVRTPADMDLAQRLLLISEGSTLTSRVLLRSKGCSHSTTCAPRWVLLKPAGSLHWRPRGAV
jgi:regulator of sirC expression with transglutaminase-like and TPR domain